MRSSNMCLTDDGIHQVMGSIQIFNLYEAYREPAEALGPRDKVIADEHGHHVDLVSAYFPRGAWYGVIYDPVVCPVARAACGDSAAVPNLEQYFPVDQAGHPSVVAYNESFYCRQQLANTDLAQCSFAVAGATPPLHVDLGHNYEAGFACREATSGSGSGSGGFDTSSSEGCGEGCDEISPMASLVSLPVSRAFQTVISRGTPKLFPATVLLIFIPIFFLLSCFSSGTAMPSGVVVPLLLNGACLGRLFGLFMLWFSEQVASPRPAPLLPQPFHATPSRPPSRPPSPHGALH